PMIKLVTTSMLRRLRTTRSPLASSRSVARHRPTSSAFSPVSLSGSVNRAIRTSSCDSISIHAGVGLHSQDLSLAAVSKTERAGFNIPPSVTPDKLLGFSQRPNEFIGFVICHECPPVVKDSHE